MTNEEIIAALGSWIEGAIPEVAGHVYTAAPASKDLGLPDCALVLIREAPDLDEQQFPWAAVMQQIDGYTLTVVCSFMVEVGADVAGEQAADAAVRSIAERVKRACRGENIGLSAEPQGAVVGVAPTFDYDPPYVEYQDGTRGREMSATLSVAQLL